MVLFYNYSTADFTHTWGGVPYTFKAGEVYQGVIIAADGVNSMFLNDVLAHFFAKHLAEFVLNTSELNTNFVTNAEGYSVGTEGHPMKYNITSIETLTTRGITAPDIEVAMPKFVDELPVIKKAAKKASKEDNEPAKTEKKPTKAKEESSPSPEAEFNV